MIILSVTGLATNLWMGRFDKARPPEGSKLPTVPRRQALQDDVSDDSNENGRMAGRQQPQDISKGRLYNKMARQQKTRRNERTRTSGQSYSKERTSLNSVKGLMTYKDPHTINGTIRGKIHRIIGLATNLWFGRFDKTRPPERPLP
jgi:hypothetical protein